jgi:putative SOS response-associated peptidase YedK
MTMTANYAIPPIKDRMPVLLDPSGYERWLHGTPKDVILCQYRERSRPSG